MGGATGRGSGTTIGLVHGAWHGAWCWERLIPLLEARGHRVVAVDLPSEDPSAGAVACAEHADQALPPADDLVLVGHSLGGLTVPLVAARRPVRLTVFLCAAVPAFGRSLEEQVGADPGVYAPGYATRPERRLHPDGTVSWTSEQAVREVFYQDCDAATAAWAWPRLRRQAEAPRRERCPLTAWSGAVASIHCAGDRVVAPDWSRRVARERLGVESLELPGGHSPFLSRPAVLAEWLDWLVRDRAGGPPPSPRS